MPAATLLLFDIDGTLVRGSRAARRAFADAAAACLGVAVDLTSLDSAGKTDLRIMREILDAHGRRGAEVGPLLLTCYLERLAEAIARDPGEVCPGVRPLLDRLSHHPDMALALGTGNLERGAKLKLHAHGLDGYFPTGGFGDDGANREDVIASAIARAERYFDTRFPRVAVIGDTPHDVASARANLVPCLAVATGPCDAQTLRAAGAAVVVDDFSHADAVVDALLSLPADRTRRRP